MKKASDLIERAISWHERLPSAAPHVIAVILFVSIVRLGLETFPNSNIDITVTMLRSITLLSFYAGSFFIFLFAASLIFSKGGVLYRPIIMLSVFGGIAPPFITLLASLFTPRAFGVAYSYFGAFDWNFFSPTQPLGEGIGIWLGIFAVAAYVSYRKRSIAYFFIGLSVFYAVAQFSGWFWAMEAEYLAHALSPLKPSTPYFPLFAMDFMWAILSIAAYVWMRRGHFAATLKRFHYTIGRGALVLSGAWLAGSVSLLSGIEALALVLAAMLVQAENDYYDKSDDEVSGRASTLTQDDLIFVRFFMALLALPFLVIQPLVSLCIGLCFLLGFAYNHPLFRLKKHFVTASLIQAGGSFLCLLIGILSSSWYVVTSGELWSIAAISIVLGILANIKDYKDLIADKKAGIVTLHLWLERFGVSPKKTQRTLVVLSCAVFLLALVIYMSFPELLPAIRSTAR
jgi:hypothetical protein